LQQTLQGHTGSVETIAFSPDGKRLASGSLDGTIKLWDAASGQLQQTLQGHTGSVRTIAFSPDGKQLASGSDDETIKLWDAESGNYLQTIQIDISINSLSFHKDSRYLETESGLVKFRESETDNSSLQPQNIHGIFLKHDWIMRDTERVLWIPFKYRARCSNVRDNKLVLGHASGRVTLLTFDFSRLNQTS
ncbi:hypothetical protein MMC21_008411, partial [Puttea exsequens]|nr:hypothetical protein [Puttea exsequens]